MQWRVTPKPEIGDTRQVYRFLWFPKIVGDRKVWLEKVIVEQKFMGSWFDRAYIVPKYITINGIRWPQPGMTEQEQFDLNYERIKI